MNQIQLWLRAETKPQEQRTALSPEAAKALIEQGYKVTVERSPQSIFPDEAYQQIGAELVELGSWIDAPSDAIILGLKELPEDSFPLKHDHIYFAHAYKEQEGWQALLCRFKAGGGRLFDLEYLVDENQRRIAAFGYWAGFSGAALGVLAWFNKQLGIEPALNNISSFADKQALLSHIKSVQAQCRSETMPRVLVIGAKGRSGSGATDLAKALSLEVVEWDLAETKVGGPFAEINEMDVLVNCVLINQDLPPFVTRELLESSDRKLSVIADVSCDPYGSYNPIPVYNKCTTFIEPCIKVISGDNSLDLIAIDHLPSLLPKESSEDYGSQLLPHLLTLAHTNDGVWGRALAIFNDKTSTF